MSGSNLKRNLIKDLEVKQMKNFKEIKKHFEEYWYDLDTPKSNPYQNADLRGIFFLHQERSKESYLNVLKEEN